MRNPASRDDLFELGNVAQRVEMIRFAQAFLARIDQPEPSSRRAERVDPAKPGGDRARSFARVYRRTTLRPAPARATTLPACRAAPAATGARARRARYAFVNVPSANGSRRRSPISRSTPWRASAEKNGLMSMPTVVARQSRFHRSARPLPQPEIDDQVGRSRREKRAQHVVADSRSEQRRRDRLVPRVGVERLVQVLGLLGIFDARPEIEVVR